MMKKKAFSALFATAIISSGVLVNTSVGVSANNDTHNAITQKGNNSIIKTRTESIENDNEVNAVPKDVTKAELLNRIHEVNEKIKANKDTSPQGSIDELNSIQADYATLKALEGLPAGQRVRVHDMWGAKTYQDVKINNDTEIDDVKNEEAHSETLHNDVDIEQKLKTMGFEEDIVNSVTTTTTETAGVSSTSTAKISFPGIEGSESITAKFDFTSSKAVNTSTTKKYIAPSQDIIVPAHKKYMIKWILTRGSLKGTADLKNQVTGVVPYATDGKNMYGTSVGNTIREYRRLVTKYFGAEEGAKALPGWTADGGAGYRKIAAANYEVDHGSKMDTQLVDVTDSSNPVVIKTMPAKMELKN